MDTSWYWRKLIKVRDKMTAGFDPYSQKWFHSSTGIYTPSAGYEWLRHRAECVSWYIIVWHKHRIPKCVFITWLTLHERILTKDRLQRLGISADQTCILCNQGNESIQHFYFDCPFMKAVCNQLLEDILHISDAPLQWELGRSGFYNGKEPTSNSKNFLLL